MIKFISHNFLKRRRRDSDIWQSLSSLYDYSLCVSVVLYFFFPWTFHIGTIYFRLRFSRSVYNYFVWFSFDFDKSHKIFEILSFRLLCIRKPGYIFFVTVIISYRHNWNQFFFYFEIFAAQNWTSDGDSSLSKELKHNHLEIDHQMYIKQLVFVVFVVVVVSPLLPILFTIKFNSSFQTRLREP